VERSSTGLVIDRTEPWSFCIGKAPSRPAAQYIILGDLESDAIHRPVDDMLYFRFDGAFTSDRLTCSVLDSKGERIVAPGDVQDHLVVQRSPSALLCAFDLSPYGLKAGTYTLVVTDGKGKRDQLRFSIKL
jgi:hypothetical protein